VNQDAPQPPVQVRAAVAIVALQALALLATAVILVVKTAFGDPNSIARALLDAAFALGGAVLLGLAARSLLRLRPAARTPLLVIELLAIPVSYSLAFQAHRVGYGGPILVSALAVIYLLFTPPARATLDRDPPSIERKPASTTKDRRPPTAPSAKRRRL
jgi:peptidoglycan/LPS O-acetylase OafA/YrhL